MVNTPLNTLQAPIGGEDGNDKLEEGLLSIASNNKLLIFVILFQNQVPGHAATLVSTLLFEYRAFGLII